jgi:hypothetical protein
MLAGSAHKKKEGRERLWIACPITKTACSCSARNPKISFLGKARAMVVDISS